MSDIVNKRILAVGHSHLGALARAYNRFYGSSAAPPKFNFSCIWLRRPKFRPNVVRKVETRSAIERQIEFLRAHIFSPNGRRVPHGTSVRKLNDVIEVDFKNLIRRESPDLIVSCAMGNECNGIAMLNHPRRFDFYLPRWPDLPTDESAEILPVDVVEDLLRSRFERKLALYLDMLSKHGGNIPKIHIPPPPPVRDAAHIESYPGAFGAMVKKFGVSPAFFRLKMWKLTCMVQKTLCDRAGVTFHSVPGSVVDPDGFLAKSFLNKNPSHGNVHYGKIILDDIAGTNFSRSMMEKMRERAPVQESAEPLLLAARS